MDSKQFDTLLERLDRITRLLAVQIVKGIEKEQDKVEFLDSLGFRPVEIAKLLNKSPENVSVVLSNLRKKKTLAPSNAGAQIPSTPPPITTQAKGS